MLGIMVFLIGSGLYELANNQAAPVLAYPVKHVVSVVHQFAKVPI